MGRVQMSSPCKDNADSLLAPAEVAVVLLPVQPDFSKPVSHLW